MAIIGKKRRLTLEEYSALKTAYGDSYSRKDLVVSIMKPFIIMSVYSMLVTFVWWLSLIYGMLAAGYQYFRINPMNANREYNQKAFQERNQFINNLTQILTNPNTTTLDGLVRVLPRTNGQFKEDLKILVTQLKGASVNKIKESFELFKENHTSDIVFCQYIDQVETAIIDGRTNIEILKNSRKFHNFISDKRNEYLDKKSKRTLEFKLVTGFILLLLVLLAISQGFDTYLEGFAYSFLGYVTLNLFLFCNFLVFRSHLKKQEDDEIMEIDVR